MARAIAVALVLAVFVLASPMAGDAQEAEPRIASQQMTPASATVGDRITLTIEIDHAGGVAISGPGFGDAYGGLDIVDIAPPETKREGDGERTTLRYEFAAFELGAYTVPPLTIAWTSGGDTGTLTTGEQRVEIVTVLSPDDQGLRPLKPQLEIEDPAPAAIVPIAFWTLFGALTLAGYWLVRRAMAVPPPLAVAPPAPLLAHDRARLALDALQHADISLHDRYAAIALTLRAYLSERHAFPAYAMTRRELERGMTRAGIDRWPARLTANLLEQCDAVQFAGFVPAPERVDADLTAAYEIIALTTPDEVAASHDSPTPAVVG